MPRVLPYMGVRAAAAGTAATRSSERERRRSSLIVFAAAPRRTRSVHSLLANASFAPSGVSYLVGTRAERIEVRGEVAESGPGPMEREMGGGRDLGSDFGGGSGLSISGC